jgi:thioredoxin 1
MITEITSQNFNEEVLNCDTPVFACFTASTCGTCFALHLVIDDLVKQYEERVKFVMINVEKEPLLATKYNIVPLPAMLVFRGSEPVTRVLGFHVRSALSILLDSVLTGNEKRTERSI